MSTAMLHDTTFSMEYATFSAREASFAPPSKRSKIGGWPHAAPKPADLARAGFYFKPSAHSNDNAVCFLCSRNLDGWEEEDDPIQEHLKHAEECGWALLMSLEAEAEFDTSNMEDPTEPRITNARRATFAVGWPHESKRGWTCKTEKMVEAGWHFAPTTDSEDYVSCAYCKLSLDGWEPKDNPFDEHYSRSPSCPFFVFAGTTAPSKRPKAKKGRASRASRGSKASRMSTQSNATVQSEAPETQDVEIELDESVNTSAVSLMSTASTATTKGKRKAGATRATKAPKTKRAKATKPKKVEPELEPKVEPDVEVEATTESASRHTPEEQVIYPSIEPPAGPGSQAEIDLRDDSQHNHPTPRPLSPASSLGPPEREASAIPVAVDSPIPLSSTRRQSARQSKQERQPRSSPLRPSPQQHDQQLPQATIHQQTTVASTPSTPQSQTSDIENAPPSTRPKSVRPPIPFHSPNKAAATATAATSTATETTGSIQPRWDPIDVEMLFEQSTPEAVAQVLASSGATAQINMTEAERQMTVQDWIKHIAGKAEEDLRMEGERVVSIFEKQGQKALTVLERIVCT